MRLEERVRELILSNPSHLKSGLERIAKKLKIKNVSGNQLMIIKAAKKSARQELKGITIGVTGYSGVTTGSVQFEAYLH